MAEISFRDVTKVYGDGTEAVTSLSLDIAEGEFVVLVGPSGCGKSTLLRMLAGLEAITTGEILVDGEVVNQVHPRNRDVAMVFQNYALYPHMTVFANIAFPLRQARMATAEVTRRVTEVAETLELTEHLKRRPASLSGGQRQRVAIGRAIVRQPKAFLLDEPLSNLDAKLRVQMRGELAQLHATLGVTTVFVTHDQTEAMTLGERVAVLNDGELRQVGTPQELYHRPADLFVAGFIGSPAMNLVRAEVRSGEGAGDLVMDFAAAGSVSVPEAAAELCASAPQDTELVAGIRPESLLLRDPAAAAEDLPRARVRFTELVEPETYVHLAGDFSGVDPGDPDAPPRDTLVARVRSDRTFTPGEEVALEIDGTGLHLFDIESGRTIR
ncbi:MAG: sn-glycerol-3-phosphate ABC transporter ATP-binding protein UgpC [bacterium]|nr:sn-glycerol-3-phosphate ABC transporter ATP-binding protein UgpC [bacterium]